MFAVKIFADLERTPWLQAEGSLANTAGVTSLAGTIQSQPGVECAFFAISPSGPFANAYWYKQLGAAPLWTKFSYAASFMFPTQGDSDASRALELDLQQVIGGQVFNFGWQADFADSSFRVWDRSTGSGGWVAAIDGLPRWKSNQWYTMVGRGHRTATELVYTEIAVDDVTSKINIVKPLAKIDLPDMLNVGVQIDTGQKPYRVMVDAMSLTVSE